MTINFNKIKALCKEHEECLRKMKLIDNSLKEEKWLAVITNDEEDNFILDDDELKALREYISSKALKIQNEVESYIFY